MDSSLHLYCYCLNIFLMRPENEWIRIGDPRGFNKGCSSKFCVGSWVWQTPEEGRRTYRPKHCGNNNKDEDNSLKTLNDKNHQGSSQKLNFYWSFSIKDFNKRICSLYIYIYIHCKGYIYIYIYIYTHTHTHTHTHTGPWISFHCFPTDGILTSTCM